MSTASSTGGPDLSSGLVAHWRMDGNGNDELGNHDATRVGNPGYSTGHFGQALRTTGSADYLRVPDAAALDLATTLSLSLWLRLGTDSPAARVISKGSNSGSSTTTNYGVWLGADSSLPGDPRRFRFATVSGSSTFIAGNTRLDEDRFYHLVFVVNGGSLAIYVDGALDVTAAIPDTLPTNNQPIALGYDDARDTFGLNGWLDDVRLWNRALTADDVAALYAGAP